ncbi:hypothetical protein CC2G_004419 [Coprinopsis cinerea AmutBmut pab1-1]|nr:hypothetical protein CC2G_004419 [Coprinopsis cinerea AmutBmut pab1-1]
MPHPAPSGRSFKPSKSRNSTPSSHVASSKSGLKAPIRTSNRAPSTLPARSRNAVNTNLNSYKRTDPTGALNALVKLVSSLSTRVGGCQYKFTAAEHSLSLHLLSIVEPYVYQGARTLSMATNSTAADRTVISGFAFQPTEILDAIIYFVDSKKDLLNIGLCCKRLHDIVFPRHFDYRVIKCKVSSISVWNHLSIHRSLARNVRRLEIIDERAKVSLPRLVNPDSSSTTSSRNAVVLPRGINLRDTDLDSTDDELRHRGIHGKQEKYLLSALQRMTGLKEFKWACNHSPISMSMIWETLMERAGCTLERMEICNNLVFTASGTDEETSDDSSEEEAGHGKRVVRAHLTALKAATFTSARHTYGAGKLPILSRIAGVLERCPNLESLTIDYTRPAGPTPSGFLFHPKIDHLFNVGDGMHWNHLTKLRLGGIWSTNQTAISQFLSSHPTIEVLNLIDLRGLTRIDLPINSLPRLREVEASREVINCILDSPCFASSTDSCLDGFGEEVLRPLEVVKGFNLSGSHHVASSNRSPDQLLLSNLKRHSSTIKRVELGGWHDMDDLRKLAKSVPGITYLDLGKRLGVGNAQRAGAVAPVTNMEEWLEVLVDLPELRALHGVKFFYEVSALNGASGPVLAAGTTSVSPISAPTSSSLASHSHSYDSSISTTDHQHLASSSKSPTAHSQTQLTLAQMSLMDRSRMKKNDWMASMLVWRCPKLRRVDHWETSDGSGSGKIIILTRTRASANGSGGVPLDVAGVTEGETMIKEGAMVKWEVRRVRAL